MIGMKPHPGLPLDEVGDARGRPQRRVVAEGLRSLTEGPLDLVELGGAESGFATGASGLLQTVGPLRLPDGVPAPTGLGADTQMSGDGGLAETTSEEFGRTEAALLELVKVALQSFEVSHTTFDTATPKSVHYIIQVSIEFVCFQRLQHYRFDGLTLRGCDDNRRSEERRVGKGV